MPDGPGLRLGAAGGMQVEQFAGSWLVLPADQQTALPRRSWLVLPADQQTALPRPGR